MEHAWGYVSAGYGIATVALGSYVVSLFRRRRRLERPFPGDADG